MIKKMRPRYYCEFCGKSGGHPYYMREHEKHCTMNPNRQCKMCEYVPDGGASLDKLIAAIPKPGKVTCYDGSKMDDVLTLKDLKPLFDMTDCHVCILAAICQSGVFVPDFNFKKRSDEFWSQYREDQMANEYY